MAYIKNTWVDQEVERPRTYQMITNDIDGTVTLVDSFGLVSELGTPVNADNMNHIEEGIAACDLRKYDPLETYATDEWVTGLVNGDKNIYKSLIDNNLGNPLIDENAWEMVKLGGGASRNIGETVFSLLPLTDAGLHMLDGSLLPGAGSYRAFVQYIAKLYGDGTNIPAYFTTEDEFQTSVEKYGVCGKFVYDSENNSVRLPKVTGIVEGTLDPNALGELVQAGLPNLQLSTNSAGAHTHTRGTMEITGSFSGVENANNNPTGAFYSYGSVNGGAQGEGDKYVGFEASRAWTGSTSSNGAHTHNINVGNSIVGNSDTVQPQTVKGFIYIVVANSIKTDIEVDIDNIMTDVNLKAGKDELLLKANTALNNLTETGESHFDSRYLKLTDQSTVAEWGIGFPSERFIGLSAGASGTQYTAPDHGFVVFRMAITPNTAGYISIQTELGLAVNNYSPQGYHPEVSLQVKKGQLFTITYASGMTTVDKFRFVYALQTPTT